jgi:hypothetical protein
MCVVSLSAALPPVRTRDYSSAVVLLLLSIMFVAISTSSGGAPGGLTPCGQYFTQAGLCALGDYAQNVTDAASQYYNAIDEPFCCGFACSNRTTSGVVMLPLKVSPSPVFIGCVGCL